MLDPRHAFRQDYEQEGETRRTKDIWSALADYGFCEPCLRAFKYYDGMVFYTRLSRVWKSHVMRVYHYSSIVYVWLYQVCEDMFFIYLLKYPTVWLYRDMVLPSHRWTEGSVDLSQEVRAAQQAPPPRVRRRPRHESQSSCQGETQHDVTANGIDSPVVRTCVCWTRHTEGLVAIVVNMTVRCAAVAKGLVMGVTRDIAIRL